MTAMMNRSLASFVGLAVLIGLSAGHRVRLSTKSAWVIAAPASITMCWIWANAPAFSKRTASISKSSTSTAARCSAKRSSPAPSICLFTGLGGDDDEDCAAPTCALTALSPTASTMSISPRPSITSIKQLKGKKVAVSRFGSGSHFQTNLALKEGGLDPEKDVTVLQIGNSGARMAAILSGIVDGTIMAADFVPRAKKGRLQRPRRSRRHQNRVSLFVAHTFSAAISTAIRNSVKALIRSMSESIRALQSDPATAKMVIRVGAAHRRCGDGRLRSLAQRPSIRSPAVPDSGRHSNCARRIRERCQNQSVEVRRLRRSARAARIGERRIFQIALR